MGVSSLSAFMIIIVIHLCVLDCGRVPLQFTHF